MRTAVLIFAIFLAPQFLSAQVDVPPPPNAPPPNALPGDQDVPATDPEGVETLTRGPIHEAFANPVEADPKP